MVESLGFCSLCLDKHSGPISYFCSSYLKYVSSSHSKSIEHMNCGLHARTITLKVCQISNHVKLKAYMIVDYIFNNYLFSIVFLDMWHGHFQVNQYHQNRYFPVNWQLTNTKGRSKHILEVDAIPNNIYLKEFTQLWLVIVVEVAQNWYICLGPWCSFFVSSNSHKTILTDAQQSPFSQRTNTNPHAWPCVRRK